MSFICKCGHKDWEHRILKGEDGWCNVGKPDYSCGCIKFTPASATPEPPPFCKNCGHKKEKHRASQTLISCWETGCLCQGYYPANDLCPKCEKPNTRDYHYQGLCNFNPPDKSIGKIDGDKVEKWIFKQVALENIGKPELWALFQSELYGGGFK